MAAAWQAFHDLRAAASANAQNELLLNSVSHGIMVNELWVVLAASHLCVHRATASGSEGPLPAEDDGAPGAVTASIDRAV